MRTYYIAGNWKMNMTASEARDFAQKLVKKLDGSDVKIMVAPPFTALESVSSIVRGTSIVLGAQNMCHKESGAHTGEVSADMLLDLDVSTVILGHSERRAIYKETDSHINEKVRLALAKGLEVIFCVGETLEERESGKVEDVVLTQVREGLASVEASQLSSLVIAYEPVWAIGTGKTATPEDANAVHKLIRDEMRRSFGDEAADSMIIQYGGSVKPDNAAELMSQSDIDGALVGGASLDVDSFAAIAQFNA